jgi:hypothetical protein
MAFRTVALAALIVFPFHGEALKASAAEQRRYEGSTDCTGNYTVLNADVMNKCTPYLIPAPASILVNQTNDTHYASYHFQGPQDCSGKGKLLDFFAVGECTSFGDYSQKRVWVVAPKPPVSSCDAPGVCGRAYQTCCVASGIKGNKCTCHLHNGTGAAGSQNCGTCGKDFVKCCSAFQMSGHPCGCDVSDDSAVVVV